MNLTEYKGYLKNKKVTFCYYNRNSTKSSQDGFTLIEVLIAMFIMSILGMTVWMGFAVAVNLIHTVPQSTKLMQEFITLDSVLREYMSRVRLPFWQPELNYYIDSTSALFPFYEGVEKKFLLIEFMDNEIYLKTFNEDDEEEDETLFHTGPFQYVYFNEVSEKKQGLIGLEIVLKPEHEKLDEFTIFTRLGGYSFQKP